MRTPIHLPVLDRLQVSNYPLYPGAAKNGLDLIFSAGVTVIAGVNGIGKTTLLNLALRMLLGASNPSKAATRDIGKASRRSLVNTKKFKFFAARVPNLPAAASAVLTYRIGATKVVIERSLVDLSIIKLTVGKESIKDSTNAQFLDRMAVLAGMSSAYDYHMVVRYVQFFTEERLPLLWSATAQVELFKMLFAEAPNMASLNALYKEIQKVDSDLRNRVYQLNDRKEMHAKVIAAVGLDGVGVEEVRRVLQETQDELAQASKAVAFGNQSVQDAIAQQDAGRRELDDLQNRLDQITHEFHKRDAAFISQILPVPHKDKMALLIQGLTSNLGCFVCGRAGSNEVAVINERLEQHHCFICDGKLPEIAADEGEQSPQELLDLEEKIATLEAEILRREAGQEEGDKVYSEALAALRPLAVRRNELVHKLEQLAIQWPNEVMAANGGNPGELASEEAAIEQLRVRRNQLNQDYRTQIAALSTRMGAFEQDLGQRLTAYAEQFLLEKVAVEFSRNASVKIVTGAVPIKVPTFRVSMTSSTHMATHERTEPSSVSESQKEFLDLAFRMTLLDMIGADSGTMLIMETPEASLDSWFMERAALMIRKFAAEGGATKLIATSNVNGTSMIPDLLGLKDGERLASKDSHRLINLMTLAAEPGVLKEKDAKAALLAEMRKYADA
ncbi:TPA: AAA family ATPase [Stenotrophomonas maltophilia]|uniref:AAA family ATPase n=1 Tax=Stenotrophomonas TaxID=40323 RepID=UPI0013101813|nr:MULTISPECIES: AAA family ATPase [Stenotrophomonas]MBH1590862.1 AAA family ATPase [Stenotrophomonas maltophilia]MDH2021717.1 AAA family ATPase [Stenotrophomonas sp. GD03680]HDS1321626.1 AAA family ATPase [Stenotrophomonas maltophilia]HDS1326235.1 AAA family ATPase [Stenotrophomonas maltophilia]HDS1330941.1 AAA family ATPase [Stenotrophomonas maltophilia]